VLRPSPQAPSDVAQSRTPRLLRLRGHRLVSSSVLGRAGALHARLFARCGNATASTSPRGSWPHSRVPTPSSSRSACRTALCYTASLAKIASPRRAPQRLHARVPVPYANERLPALGSPVGTSSLRSLEPGPPAHPRTMQVRSPDPVARMPPAWTGTRLPRLSQGLLRRPAHDADSPAPLARPGSLRGAQFVPITK